MHERKWWQPWFNFMSLPSSAADENWDLPTYCLLYSLSLENDAVFD